MTKREPPKSKVAAHVPYSTDVRGFCDRCGLPLSRKDIHVPPGQPDQVAEFERRRLGERE